ncbi:MAG TPA: RnfH family protein [Burkholderiales bacterium]|nr:RnfH family protein [Burkholderiales bacterium]
MTEEIDIEVVYALPDVQTLLALKVPAGTTVIEALERSGIVEKHPEIDIEKNKIGIFGRLVKNDTTLRENDRIEIYRPLIADPKEVRKKRAEEGKVMKKGGGDLSA